MLGRLGLKTRPLGQAGLGQAGCRYLSFYPAELVDVPPNSGAVVGKVSSTLYCWYMEGAERQLDFIINFQPEVSGLSA